jgi:estrogen-related receptor beta like 1
MWENALEKLKILNYEVEFCYNRGRKVFNRIHFIFPGQNPSTQFDEFMELCSWLCSIISPGSDVFKRDPYDDPTTVSNKLMLALRQLDCKLQIQPQTLKKAHGETACGVLDFLTDKALSTIKFSWSQPTYQKDDNVNLYRISLKYILNIIS